MTKWQHYKKDMNMLLRKVELDFQILWKFLNLEIVEYARRQGG